MRWMRLGLIGDVHAEDERLRLAIAHLAREKVDHVLCVGNLVDGHGDVDLTCALIAHHRIATVRGNHDRWIRDDEMRMLPNAHRMTALSPDAIAVLKGLPPSLELDVGYGMLLLCHGVGTDDMARLTTKDKGFAISTNEALMKVLVDTRIVIMVCGHTHQPMVRRFERGADKPPLVVVNAGTLARSDDPGFAILDTVARRVDFFRISDDLTQISPISRAML